MPSLFQNTENLPFTTARRWNLSAMLFHMQQNLNFYILTHTDFRLRRLYFIYLRNWPMS